MEVFGPRVPLRTAQLLLLLVAACRGQKVVNAVVGGNVTLEAKYTGIPTEINWKVNGHKYVDMELIPKLSKMFYRNKDRSSIENNGNLTITGLNKTDAGDYKAEALVNNRFQETDYRLAVYERLSEPAINDSSTNEQIIVTCQSVESDVSSYEWQNSIGARVSSNLTYETPRPKEGVTLICVVRNPASENRTSITIPRKPGPWPIWLIILVTLLLLALVIAAWCFWYFRYKSFKRAFRRFDNPQVHPKDKKAEAGTEEEGEQLGQRDLFAMFGEDVTLVAKYTGKPTEINWKVNGDKYVDMELIPELSKMFYRNKDRSSIENNGNLTIKGLDKDDAGAYKAEALVNNRFQETDCTLTMYENRIVQRINTVFGFCGRVKPKPDSRSELPKAKGKTNVNEVRPEAALPDAKSEGKKPENTADGIDNEQTENKPENTADGIDNEQTEIKPENMADGNKNEQTAL